MIYNADCLDVLSQIENQSIDLVVTDCPYKIVSGGATKNRDNTAVGGILGKHRGVSNNLNIEETRKGKMFKHNDILFKDWLPEIYRVLKPNTHCYIMINARNVKELQTECEKVGFQFQNLLIWEKGNVTPNKFYMNAYEMILMLKKGKARKINNMGYSNILKVPNVKGQRNHPTEKPIELMKILIENSSNIGDVVLDPFMGSGSTGVACKDLQRDFIGIEIDKTYFDVAERRLADNLWNTPKSML